MIARRTGAPRSLLAGLVVSAIAASLLVVGAGAASATSGLADLTDHTYQANGRVAAILPIGNVLYLAGSFTSMRPYDAPAGTGEVARNFLAAVDRDTGQLLQWNPGANKEAYSLAASPDGSIIYVGGLFTQVAGVARAKVAALSASTGALLPWAPTADNKVNAIAVTANRIYLGGTFTIVNGQPRASLAAVDTAGVLDNGWTPAPDDKILAMTASPNGSTIYAGGDFLSINGDTRQKHFAALSATTGALLPWALHPGYPIYAMTINGANMYLGGNGAGGHASAYTLSNGARLWDDQTDGGVQGVAVIGSELYVGGHFDNFCDPSVVGTTGLECPVILATRHKIFAVDALTGVLDPWDPGADSPLGVFAVTTSGGRLQMGGDFLKAGHFHNQQGFAQFSPVGTPVTPVGDAFAPVTPTRILDTRTGLGLVGGLPARVAAAKPIKLQVGGVAGVPLGIDAVVLNVTAVAPTATTYVSAYPGDLTSPPLVSNINVARGRIVPNLVTVKVDTTGKINLFNAVGTVDLLADVAGYYASDAVNTYSPLTPVRILDTRSGLGAPLAQLGPAGTTDLQVTGVAGIPSDATAVVMNVTATGATASTFVQAYPTPAGAGTPPTVSNLNIVAGRTVANLVTVQIGDSGRVRLGNSVGSVDVLADVAGYFSSATTGSRYTPISPTRLLDTRTSLGEAVGQTGKVGPGGLIDLQLTGAAAMPLDATAAVFNYTAVSPKSATYVQAYPTPASGSAFPTVSTLNPLPGDVLANMVSVSIGAGGKVRLRNQAGTVDLLADLAGYYTSDAGVAHGTAPAAPSVKGVTAAATATPTHPSRGTTVTINVTTVAGATVSGTASFTTGPVIATATADGTGLAILTYAVGTATAGVVVPVAVIATSASLGSTASAKTTFTPVA